MCFVFFQFPIGDIGVYQLIDLPTTTIFDPTLLAMTGTIDSQFQTQEPSLVYSLSLNPQPTTGPMEECTPQDLEELLATSSAPGRIPESEEILPKVEIFVFRHSILSIGIM